MVSRTLSIITGLIALVLVSTFTIGLTHSISVGFAGFKGWGSGLPIAVIVALVLSCAAYDLYDSAIRKSK